MRTNDGKRYLETRPGIRRVNNTYSVRRVGNRSWLVFSNHSGVIHGAFPTRLRAYYVASELNGWVKEAFHFGTGMFGGEGQN
jgi:hypothetical protein